MNLSFLFENETYERVEKPCLTKNSFRKAEAPPAAEVHDAQPGEEEVDDPGPDNGEEEEQEDQDHDEEKDSEGSDAERFGLSASRTGLQKLNARAAEGTVSKSLLVSGNHFMR
jgi:hypothetical protein